MVSIKKFVRFNVVVYRILYLTVSHVSLPYCRFILSLCLYILYGLLVTLADYLANLSNQREAVTAVTNSSSHGDGANGSTKAVLENDS